MKHFLPKYVVKPTNVFEVQELTMKMSPFYPWLSGLRQPLVSWGSEGGFRLEIVPDRRLFNLEATKKPCFEPVLN